GRSETPRSFSLRKDAEAARFHDGRADESGDACSPAAGIEQPRAGGRAEELIQFRLAERLAEALRVGTPYGLAAVAAVALREKEVLLSADRVGRAAARIFQKVLAAFACSADREGRPAPREAPVTSCCGRRLAEQSAMGRSHHANGVQGTDLKDGVVLFRQGQG